MRWSWGIGMWAFIFPLACIPMICCMLHMRYLAGKTEEWKVFKQRKTKFQELGIWGFVKYLFWNLDVIGLVLFVVGIGCILIPLTVAGGTKSKWQQGNVIAPIVVGVVVFVMFVIWEARFARNPFLPWNLMKDRGIWSAGLISFLLDFVSGVESSYLYAVLIVAVNESEKSATRITSLPSFVSVVAGVFFGLFMVKFKRLKGFIIFGISMWIVAFGILIHFRGSLDSHSGIIGGLCLMGFGTTFFSYPITVSVQSCVTHENMAKMTSVIYTVYRVGAAVGAAVSGAIWTQTLYGDLYRKLGDADLAMSVYSQPYEFAANYGWETQERQDAVQVYRKVQKILMIVSICLCVPMLIAAFFLRDHKLGNAQSIDDVEEIEKDDDFVDFMKQNPIKKIFKRSNNKVA